MENPNGNQKRLTDLCLQPGEASDPQDLAASALDRVVGIPMVGRVTMVFWKMDSMKVVCSLCHFNLLLNNYLCNLTKVLRPNWVSSAVLEDWFQP